MLDVVLIPIAMVGNRSLAEPSPTFQWAQKPPSSGSIYLADGLMVDPIGACLVIGSAGSWARIGEIVFGQSSGSFILKYNPSGNLAWVKYLSDSSADGYCSIVMDRDGSL